MNQKMNERATDQLTDGRMYGQTDMDADKQTRGQLGSRTRDHSRLLFAPVPDEDMVYKGSQEEDNGQNVSKQRGRVRV